MNAIEARNASIVFLSAEPVPFALGQRVRVTCGGHRGEEGRVYAIRTRWDDPDGSGPIVIVNLDTLMLFHGSRRCLEVIAEQLPLQLDRDRHGNAAAGELIAEQPSAVSEEPAPVPVTSASITP